MLLGLGLPALPDTALGQTAADRADARSIADEGARAFQSGDYGRALSLFERAEALVHSPVHLLFIARSQEKTGKLVDARETFLEMTREAFDRSTPRAFRKAQASAITELSALEDRIPYITIEVLRDKGKPFVVTLNDKKLPAEVVGVRRPINPGEYEVQALGPGRKSAVKRVFIVEGESQSIRLTMRKLREGEEDEYVSARADLDEEEDEEDEEDDRSRRRRRKPEENGAEEDEGAPVEAYLALGVGGIGLVAGTLFALKSSSKRQEATDLCGGTKSPCPDERRPMIAALDDEADTNRNLAIGSFVLGGAAITVGVIMLATSGGSDEAASTPKRRSDDEDDDEARSIRVRPWVGIGSAGVTGTF